MESNQVLKKRLIPYSSSHSLIVVNTFPIPFKFSMSMQNLLLPPVLLPMVIRKHETVD